MFVWVGITEEVSEESRGVLCDRNTLLVTKHYLREGEDFERVWREDVRGKGRGGRGKGVHRLRGERFYWVWTTIIIILYTLICTYKTWTATSTRTWNNENSKRILGVRIKTQVSYLMDVAPMAISIALFPNENLLLREDFNSVDLCIGALELEL